MKSDMTRPRRGGHVGDQREQRHAGERREQGPKQEEQQQDLITRRRRDDEEDEGRERHTDEGEGKAASEARPGPVGEAADGGVHQGGDERSYGEEKTDQVAVVGEQSRERSVEDDQRHAAAEAEGDGKEEQQEAPLRSAEGRNGRTLAVTHPGTRDPSRS
jgi:hypothetical protein